MMIALISVLVLGWILAATIKYLSIINYPI